MFSRNVILSLRNLDPQQFQSLVDYAGSRAAACASAMLRRMSMMEPNSLGAMAEVVGAEIVCQGLLYFKGYQVSNIAAIQIRRLQTAWRVSAL